VVAIGNPPAKMKHGGEQGLRSTVDLHLVSGNGIDRRRLCSCVTSYTSPV